MGSIFGGGGSAPTAPKIKQAPKPTSYNKVIGTQEAQNREAFDTNVTANRLNETNPFGATTFADGGVSRSLSDPLQQQLGGIYGGFGQALQGYGQAAGGQPGQYAQDVFERIQSDRNFGLDEDEARMRQSQNAKLAAQGIPIDNTSRAYTNAQRAQEDQFARNRSANRLASLGLASQMQQQGFQNQMSGLAGLGGMTQGTVGNALAQAAAPIGYQGVNYNPVNTAGIMQNYDQMQQQRTRDLNSAQNQQYANQMNEWQVGQEQQAGNLSGLVGLGTSLAMAPMTGGGSLLGAGLANYAPKMFG